MSSSLRLRTPALLLTLALTAALPALLPIHSAHAAASQQQYAIPAGPLEDVLTAFARRAGVLLSFDPAALADASSAGLQGSYDVDSGFAAILAGHALSAQRNNDGVYILRPVKRAQASDPVTLDSVLVTATLDRRAETFETPGSVAVVTREEIDRLPPRNTADILRDVSGVYTSQGRSDPGVVVNIRGLQDQGRVNVMIDGARQNFNFSSHGAGAKVYLDPALLAGVDVQKGPSSTLGGAGMIAGSVNFRTWEAADIIRAGETVGGHITTATGSNAYDFEGSSVIGIRPTDDMDFVAAISRKHIGAFRLGKHDVAEDTGYWENDAGGWQSRSTGQSQWSGLFKASWRPAIGHQIRLGYIGLDAEFNNGGGGPGSDLTGESTISASQRFESRVNTATLDYEWRPDSELVALDAQLYYTRTRRKEHRNTYYEGGVSYDVQYQTSTVGGSLINRSHLPGNWFDTTVSSGLEFYHDWTEPGFQSTSVTSHTLESNWFTGPTPEGKRTVASGFAETTLDHEGWLQLIGGLRYDWYHIKGDGEIYVGSVANQPGVRPSYTRVFTNFSVSRHDAAFAPKLTLALKPLPAMQLYASIGNGLRPPGIGETLMQGMHSGNMFPFYPNPNLKEERSRNWEVGMNLNFHGLATADDILRIKTAWFNNRVKNYITSAAIMSPTATAGCYGLLCPSAAVNLLDPVHFQGLELDMDYDAGIVFGRVSMTRVQANLGAKRYDPFPLGSWVGYPENSMGGSANANEALGSTLYSGPPRLKLAVSGGVRPFDRRLEIGARMRFEKPSHEEAYIWRAPARNIRTYDLWAAWQASDALLLRLSVDNLTDANYLELTGSGTNYSYGPGRTVIGTVQWKF
ncbi:TonB-dependent hemoglobin/transferrin/lactoferrin family receptor [Kerstersia similis]|uniref:TonB-dependent receptor n=1 Tax=Kerstersia similis TaxID=206505 RepID=UPI0039EEDFC8